MISCLLAVQLAFLASAEQPRWLVAGALNTGSPPALSNGLSLGLVGDVQRQLNGPAFVSARLGWNASSGANHSWVLQHDQFHATLGAGVSATRGVGRLWVQAGAGPAVLREGVRRNSPGTAADVAWVWGPQGFVEVGLALAVRGRWRGLLAGGPTLAFLRINDQGRWRFGAGARLGIAYDF